MLRFAAPPASEPTADKLEQLRASIYESDSSADTWDLATELGEGQNPADIATMIGLIEADNTYNTVYGIGYFGLWRLTGVLYDEAHDGPWWRAWWAGNKARYGEKVAALEIPEFPKTPAYVAPGAKAK